MQICIYKNLKYANKNVKYTKKFKMQQKILINYLVYLYYNNIIIIICINY